MSVGCSLLSPSAVIWRLTKVKIEIIEELNTAHARLFLFPRNLSDHMDRQARTRETVLINTA
jgi:hypothetical protein